MPSTRTVPSTRTTAWLAVAIYLATRVLSAGLLLVAAAQQGGNPWVDGRPSYVEITGLWWDAGWYERAAVEGYPIPAPVTERSAWAFLPLFPMLVRAVMSVTGASFAVVAPTIALVAGIAAAAGLAVLVRDQGIRGGVDPASAARRGLAAVLLLGLFPAAPVLQAGYADSLALALVVLALLLLTRRHHLVAILPVLALGFTRPVALPFAVVVALHAWRRHRDSDDAPDRRAWWGMAALTAASVAAGFAWPVVTAVAAGRWDAYLRIQEHWRHGDPVAPVLAWFSFAESELGWTGIVLVALAIALGVAAIAVPSARRLGPDLRAWTGAYLLWLLGAVQPHSSTIRQLILALGIPVLLVGDSRLRLVLAAAASFAAQVWWVMVLWRVGIAPAWPP